MADMTVATTILEQLGGRRFLAMTGAKHLVGTETSLGFTLPGTPGFVRQGINRVQITLTPMDTYIVAFCRSTKKGWKEVDRCEDIYAENLQECFTRVTGLATRL